MAWRNPSAKELAMLPAKVREQLGPMPEKATPSGPWRPGNCDREKLFAALKLAKLLTPQDPEAAHHVELIIRFVSEVLGVS